MMKDILSSSIRKSYLLGIFFLALFLPLAVSAKQKEEVEYDSFRVEYDKQQLSVKNTMMTPIVVSPGCIAKADYTITNKADETSFVYLTEKYANDDDYIDAALSKDLMDKLTMTMYLDGKQIYKGPLMGQEWMKGKKLMKLRSTRTSRLHIEVDVPEDIDNEYTNTNVIFILRFQSEFNNTDKYSISAKTWDTLVMFLYPAFAVLLFCIWNKKRKEKRNVEK